MKFHSTVIFVKEIGKSKDFYTRHLEFSMEHDFGKNVILSNGLTIWEILDNHVISKQLETGRNQPVSNYILRVRILIQNVICWKRQE